MLSALLTGVNRAFPYSKLEDATFDKHTDLLFRIAHKGSFATATQALTLIFQVSTSRQVCFAVRYLLVVGVAHPLCVGSH